MSLPTERQARPRLHPRVRIAVAPIATLLVACVQPQDPSATSLAAERWAAADSAYAGGCFASPGPTTAGTASKRPVNPGATFEAAWSMINERHFDTTFNGVDWRGVRAELLPRAQEARSTEELRGIIRDMLARLGQSHFALIPGEMVESFEGTSSSPAPKADDSRAIPARTTATRKRDVAEAKMEDQGDSGAGTGGPGAVGIELRLSDGKFLVSRVDSGSPAARAGVRTGWIVRSVDTCLLSEQLARIPAETGVQKAAFRATLLAMGRIEGEAGTTVRVEFVDGSDRRVVRRLTRTPEQGERVLFGNLPAFYTRFEQDRLEEAGRSIGVIRFNTWMTVVMPRFDAAMDDLRDADGIIVDLRGNPGGLGAMVMGTSGHFLTSRVSLGTLKSRDRDMRYMANPRLVGANGRRVQPYAGPVAILIDGLTGSTSEVFAGGMQAIGRARIIGQTSAGAVLPALHERLPYGDVLYHAFADFVTPTGDRLEGRGVIPDDVVALDRAALLAGRDSQMEAAVRWIAAQRR